MCILCKFANVECFTTLKDATKSLLFTVLKLQKIEVFKLQKIEVSKLQKIEVSKLQKTAFKERRIFVA